MYGWRGYEAEACNQCRERKRGRAAPPPAGAAVNAAGGAAQSDAEAILQAARTIAAEELRAAREQTAAMLEEAKAKAEEVLVSGRREREELLTEARMAVAEARGEAEREAAEARAAAQVADEQVRQMRLEAERILAEARVEAEAIVRGARERAEQMVQAGGRQEVGMDIGMAAREAERGPPLNSISVFFHAQLAAATNDFAPAMRLGGGGFGSVYRAQGISGFPSEKLFAVKRLDANSLQGKEEFLQEVQVLGGCRHELLLPLIGFSADGGEDGRVCLVFPLMEGGSLQDRLFPVDGRPALGWMERVRASASVAEALHYLHSPNPGMHKPVILHRDIKPANILLDADGLVRLADVGLARMHLSDRSHLTLPQVGGTAGFLDPTYMSTGQYDTSSDAFSLGVTVLMLLTGWPAFEPGSGTVFDRCDGREAGEVAAREAGWPADKAAQMLTVGLGLAEPRKRNRMSVADAAVALKGLVGAPGVVEEVRVRECLFCMAEPKAVRLACGHATYCRPCLHLALSRPNPTCPYCRSPVSLDGIVQDERMAEQSTFVRPVGR